MQSHPQSKAPFIITSLLVFTKLAILASVPELCRYFFQYVSPSLPHGGRDRNPGAEGSLGRLSRCSSGGSLWACLMTWGIRSDKACLARSVAACLVLEGYSGSFVKQILLTLTHWKEWHVLALCRWTESLPFRAPGSDESQGGKVDIHGEAEKTNTQKHMVPSDMLPVTSWVAFKTLKRKTTLDNTASLQQGLESSLRAMYSSNDGLGVIFLSRYYYKKYPAIYRYKYCIYWIMAFHQVPQDWALSWREMLMSKRP